MEVTRNDQEQRILWLAFFDQVLTFINRHELAERTKRSSCFFIQI